MAGILIFTENIETLLMALTIDWHKLPCMCLAHGHKHFFLTLKYIYEIILEVSADIMHIEKIK